MNRITMLDKNSRRLISFVAMLICSGCASRDSPQNLSSSHFGAEQALTTQEQQSLVRLIDSELTQQFPHLRRHQGQVLLTRNDLQLIVSGPGPLASTPGFMPLWSKFYRQIGKTWQAQTWLSLPELSIRTADGTPLELIGQDIETANARTQLVATYRTREQQQAQARVTLRLRPESNVLEVRVQSSTPQALEWDLRLQRGTGEAHVIPLEQESLVGISMSLLPDLMSVISSAPLEDASDGIYHLVRTAKPSRTSRFFILFGPEAATYQARLVEQAMQCPRDEEAQTTACLDRTWQRVRPWTVQLPIRNTPAKGERKFMQSLYLHTKEGAFRALVPIWEGEQLRLVRTEKETLEALYPDSEGVLRHQAFDDEDKVVQLPALQRGVLSIELSPPGPAFIEVRDAVHRNGVSLSAWLQHRASDFLSPHAFLQKQWPAQIQLPAGDYRIQVFRGEARLCQQMVTIRPERKQQLRCQAEGPTWSHGPRLNLAIDAQSSAPEFYSAASIQKAIQLTPDDPSQDKGLTMLEATDPDLGLSLRAFPVTEAMRSKWQNFRGRHGAPSLQEFATFVRQQSQPPLLSLECPPPGFPLDENQWLALQLAPDVLEVFGCQQAELAPRFMAIAQLLQKKSPSPVRIAAAAPNRSYFTLYGGIPALTLYDRPPETGSEDFLVQSLKQGAFSAGLRTSLRLVPEGLQRQGVQSTLELNISSLDLLESPAILRIYDQTSLLGEQTLPKAKTQEQTLKVPVRLATDSKWLRLELVSRERGDAEAVALLLATTNFIAL